MLSRLSLAALLAAVLASHGDEAVRFDGSRVTGRLNLDPAGRFAFRAADRDESVADLDRVHFTVRPPNSNPALLRHRVHLGHGEVLTAELRSVDEKALRVRTPWVDDLIVPRTAIERVPVAAGGRVVRFDTFSDLAGWTKIGEPRAADGKLTLDRAGQAVEAPLKPSVVAGRVGVTFQFAATTGRRVCLDLGFVRGDRPAAERVELIGPGEGYAVTTPDKPDYEGKLTRGPGTHRLTVEFDCDRLAIFVDDLVLWARDAGPGELKSVKLMAEGDGTEAATVSGVLVVRTELSGEPRGWADPTADAIRSSDGDETFGRLTAVGPAGVTLEVKGKPLRLGWTDAAEFSFRRGPVAETATTGEHVRVRLLAADGGHDTVDGAVQAFDNKTLVLAHPALGKLTLPRERVEEIRLLFHGRRVPVDTTPHHLGMKPAFGFAVPKPEGLKVASTVTLDNPGGGFVVVGAVGVKRTGTPVEVRVNGELVGELNRLADNAADVRTYRLPVAAEHWRRGDNAVEVRLRPGDGLVTGVDLRTVHLEMVDAR